MHREAHTVLADADGDPFEVWAARGCVHVLMPATGAVLGPEQQEAMGQAFIAACNAADRQRRIVHYRWPAACEHADPGHLWSGDLSRVTCEACKGVAA